MGSKGLLGLRGPTGPHKLAYTAPLVVPAGVEKHSREGLFNVLRSVPDPCERFKELAKEANVGRLKLPQPWESLRVLMLPKPFEEERLVKGRMYGELEENMKKALFYAVLALEEAFGVYRSALREYAVKKAVQRVEVGEEPFKKITCVADLGLLTSAAREGGGGLRKRLEDP